MLLGLGRFRVLGFLAQALRLKQRLKKPVARVVFFMNPRKSGLGFIEFRVYRV